MWPSSSTAKHIKIYIESDIPSNWVGGINSAIAYWNSITETQVQFKLTSDRSQSQIYISHYQDAPGTIAAAELPGSGGRTGTYVKINTDGNSNIIIATSDISRDRGYINTCIRNV